MALIRCPECNREVSNQATACPNCGMPLNSSQNKKFCQHCGEQIDKDCVICPKCGKQVADLSTGGSDKNIIINNNNNASSSASASAVAMATPSMYGTRRIRDKWVAFFLCLFLGWFGAHKFYEGKTGMGVLYIFTVGLFGIGWIVDIISLLLKPNPYYV